MKFWPLQLDGTVRDLSLSLPEAAIPVLDTFRKMYETTPYIPPWIGYLASEEEGFVGTCAFKSAPKEGLVEIAYFTFPGQEGKGVATRMVKKLLEVAKVEDPEVVVIAQTLPTFGASTTILQKLGFVFNRSLHHEEDGLVWEWHHDTSKAV